jgi:hypothetical protein
VITWVETLMRPWFGDLPEWFVMPVIALTEILIVALPVIITVAFYT